MTRLHEVAVRSMMAIITVMTAVAAVTAVTVVQMMAAAQDEQSCRRQNHQTK